MINDIRLTIRIPRKQYKQLLDESTTVGNSISSVVRIAVNNYFKEK